MNGNSHAEAQRRGDGNYGMRFTLQHVLVWQGSCLAVIALNVVIGGRCDLAQGMLTVLVCGAGCALGILVHGKIRAGKLASIWPALIGEVFMLVLVLLVYFARVPQPLTIERCTRTLCVKKHWPLGILNPTWVEYGAEAKFVRDVLKYVPGEHNWVAADSKPRDIKPGPGGPSNQLPLWEGYPVFELTLEDLRRLALTNPVEDTHLIFQWDNPADLRLALAREYILRDLRRRFGELREKRRDGSDVAVVTWWWNDYDPLLKPMNSEAEMFRAARKWYDNRRLRANDDDPELSKIIKSMVVVDRPHIVY